jgi:ribosome biogenesis GTPase
VARRRLSQRQIERIRTIQERRRQKLANRAERVLQAGEPDDVCEGLVVARHGANLAVADEQGRLYHCLARQNIGHPVCGDRVVWQPSGKTQGVVAALLPRRSILSRPDYSGREKPLAANLDRVVVVLAPRPEPSEYLLDQYLIAAEQIGVDALVTINKADLLDAETERAFLTRFAVYQRIGYPVLMVSARREHGLDRLEEALAGHTSILVGQSGVGKSSLIQALLPDLDIQIGRLSQATGLGCHTTSAATWYRLPTGGALIDSPGVRSFRLGRLQRGALEFGFRELRPYIGHCQFSDCRHDQEPGCAIRAAAALGEIDPRRLANLLHMAEQMDQDNKTS